MNNMLPRRQQYAHKSDGVVIFKRENTKSLCVWHKPHWVISLKGKHTSHCKHSAIDEHLNRNPFDAFPTRRNCISNKLLWLRTLFRDQNLFFEKNYLHKIETMKIKSVTIKFVKMNADIYVGQTWRQTHSDNTFKLLKSLQSFSLHNKVQLWLI